MYKHRNIGGLVYFVRDVASGLIKIGFTAREDVYERIRAGQNFNPNPLELLGVIEASSLDEHAWHREFSSERVVREWFKDSERLRARIREADAFIPEEIFVRVRCDICMYRAVKNTRFCRRHGKAA